MAGTKISELPVATTLTGAELVPVVQSGATKQTTVTQTAAASWAAYVPAGTGAVTTTVQDKLREMVSVKDFGAVGDGVADDTAALRVAIAAVQAATMAGNSGIYGSGSYVGTAPILHFPKGVYKVTNYLTADTGQALNYQWFVGEQAIIVADAGVTVFGGVGYDNKFEGFIFRGGACAISIKTNNIDSTRIDILKCEFHNQTTACVQTDNNSNSTLLNIDHCKFLMSQTAGGYIGKFLTGDQIYFSNTWVSCSSQVAFYVGLASLNITDSVGVPGGALAAAGGRWIDNYNSVNVDNFRYGGESGGAVLCRNYADLDTTYPVTPTRVRIHNCPAYTTRYIIEFYKLPNVVEFTSNYGFVDSDGFYFDSSLTRTDFANYQKYGQFLTDANFPNDFIQSIGTGGSQSIGEMVFLAALSRTGTYKAPKIDRLVQGQIWGSGGHGGGWSSSGTASSAYVVNDYGVQTYTNTATADGQIRDTFLSTYLNPAVLPSNRIYTLVLQIEQPTRNSEVDVIVEIGSARVYLQLEKYRKVYSIPFVYLNDTGSASASFDTFLISTGTLANGDVVQWGRHMVLEGIHEWPDDTMVLRGSGAPTAYTNGIGYNQGYYRGDTLYLANVAAGGFIGHVCTTAGAPGTWKTFGAVTP